MIDDSSQQSNQDTKPQQQSSSDPQTPSSLIEEKKPEEVSVPADQPKPENQSPVPVAASFSQENQSTPPADIDQKSSDWPISTNLANGQATDVPITPSSTPQVTKPKEEEPEAQTQDQVAPQAVETWPDSTILANSSEPIQSQPDLNKPENQSPPSSLDLSNVSNPSPPAGEAGDLSQSSSVPPAESASSQVGQSEPSLADNSAPIQSDIDAQPTTNQAQSNAPDDASKIDVRLSENQSASFKPEPLESPTIPPTPLENVSFPSPTVRFGDLIKEIEITPPSIPEAERPVEQQQPTPPAQPPPQVAPISSPLPKSSQLDQSDQSVQLDQTFPQPLNPSQPTVIVKEVIKEVPVVDQEEVNKQVTDKLKTTLDERRILANQARSRKKQNHLDRILELARNTTFFSNSDVQRLLHVSQSTTTNYLSELTSRGLLKRQGIRGGAKYSL